MNEKNIKITLVSVTIVLLLAGLISYQFAHDVAYLLLIFFFMLIASAFIAEMYFRIQHNLDKNLTDSDFQEGESRFKDKFEREITNLGQKFNLETADIKKQFNSLKNQSQIWATELNDKTNANISELNEESHVRMSELEKKLTKTLELQKNVIDKFFWQFVKETRSIRLQDLAPKLFRCKSVLYVGARIDRSDFLSDFYKNGSTITVLEIHKPNVNYFKTIPWVSEVIEGDVTKFRSGKKYDVIFWWHGPEHIEKSKLAGTLKNLESMAKKTIVLGCPWGNVPQSYQLEKENPYEKHISFFDVGEFEKFGYKADYSGLKNNSGSNIIAVKIKR